MMESSQDGSFSRPHWSVEDIPHRNIEPDKADISLELFYMLTCASFVEITSGLYARKLTEYIHDEPELRDWLERQWRCEEIQHGIALRCYVNMVWPKFDWDRAYSRFFIEYSRCCQAKQLGPTPALEMVSRCLVETETAMLNRLCSEPVLRTITVHIASDEVRPPTENITQTASRRGIASPLIPSTWRHGYPSSFSLLIKATTFSGRRPFHPVLLFECLRFDLIFPQRILVARSVEVDYVARA
jgi:hypothetical protein